jgi:Zn-finger nucleic acid-binding protein
MADSSRIGDSLGAKARSSDDDTGTGRPEITVHDPNPPHPPLLCPVCAASLVRKLRNRVPIDVCEQHGVWLDRGELEEIIQRDWVSFQSGYESIDQARLDEERRRGRLEGTLWELFFD